MRKNPIRYVWMALGILCLVLGTIGVVLPILPTVPFYMATVLMAIGFIMMNNVPIGRVVLVIVWIFHFLYFGLKVETVKEEKAKEIIYD